MRKNDLKLYFTLIAWALVPAIYLLFRMNIISINNVDINILGQMEWFDLIDEIFVTILIVPLYKILKNDGRNNKYKNGTAFLIAFLIYMFFAILIAIRVKNITRIMNAENAERYLFLQTISLTIDFINKFIILLFTMNNKYKLISKLLIIKILFLMICDYLLIHYFKDIGAVYSEIAVNIIIAIASLLIVYKENIMSFKRFDFSFIKEWINIGAYSGVQIFLDNFVYAVIIVRMVNVVSESGNYWVANNFIWGWLLVPVLCFTEIIKKNKLEKIKFCEVWKYGIYIVIVWVVTMPFWKIFLEKGMAVDGDTILAIVMPNIPFYLTYIISAFIDAWFISKGKTEYTMLISLFVNIVYYGFIYILFKNNIFTLNMNFIIMMFGGGMVVHMILSICFYKYNLYCEKNIGE